MRIKIKLMYDGANFSGFQLQPNRRTIQGELETALQVYFKQKIKTFASGRTDAGVSAMGQVVHFDVDADFDKKRFLSGVNAILPNDIAVTDAEVASADFDARFCVKKKTYRYYFYISKYPLPLFSWAARINDYADIDSMRRGCKYLLGTHDFTSFVSKKTDKTDFVRTIFNADIIEVSDGLYALEISGNGFLYNMVRIIFGTLVEVGYKKRSPEDIEQIILAKNRCRAGKTYGARALVLHNVEYNN